MLFVSKEALIGVRVLEDRIREGVLNVFYTIPMYHKAPNTLSEVVSNGYYALGNQL